MARATAGRERKQASRVRRGGRLCEGGGGRGWAEKLNPRWQGEGKTEATEGRRSSIGRECWIDERERDRHTPEKP